VSERLKPEQLKKRFRSSDIPESEWFWLGVKKTKTCWLWQRSKNNTGYGTVSWYGKALTAHVLAYTLLRGQIVEGLELDHLCKTRDCVNPDHLEPVTHKENVLRGESPSAVHSRKTHCIRGHEFSGDNLKILKRKNNKSQRVCRTCQREYLRAYYGR